MPIEPGQIWWCQGTALSFDWHLKTRPVLVLRVKGEQVDVAILTSKSHLGSVKVSHRKGNSYLTGKTATVPQSALVNYIDDWSEFDQFMAPSPSAHRGCGATFLLVALLSLLLLCAWFVLMGSR